MFLRSMQLLALLVLFIQQGKTQTNSTANDFIPPYETGFLVGANLGYYNGWTDEQLAEIAVGMPEMGIQGVGVETLRPALPEHFLEQYGYDIRVNTFEYYKTLGLKDHTVFIGYPSEAHQENVYHCPTARSQTFANLYEDIWDNGENGTPVNDENYYALYLYKMVTRYKPFVKFWEVWNEPDYDYVGNSSEPKNDPNSWWQRNPDPCEHAFHAPITHYVRMLRISYEVIKSVDPDAYVAVGGLGYPSYLHAIMRNTDNPNNGSISVGYAKRGGAYFDVLSFHSYPHIDGSLRFWSDAISDFVQVRHSDRAVQGVIRLKKEFQAVLEEFGYDGLQYPKKLNIITESNVPRKEFGFYIGSDIAQSNFLIKSLIECQKNDILQYHVFHLGEYKTLEEATNEYELMGLYKKLPFTTPYEQEINLSGYAYKTTSDLLKGYRYDAQQTAKLEMPNFVNGAAFQNEIGEYTYVLWAETFNDKDEYAFQLYSMPSSIGADFLTSKEWNYAKTKKQCIINSQEIPLNGSPIFLKALDDYTPPEDLTIQSSPNPFVSETSIHYIVKEDTNVQLAIYNMSGQLIQNLMNTDLQKAGRYQYTIADGLLDSGVYIVHFQQGETQTTMKLVKF